MASGPATAPRGIRAPACRPARSCRRRRGTPCSAARPRGLPPRRSRPRAAERAHDPPQREPQKTPRRPARTRRRSGATSPPIAGDLPARRTGRQAPRTARAPVPAARRRCPATPRQPPRGAPGKPPRRPRRSRSPARGVRATMAPCRRKGGGERSEDRSGCDLPWPSGTITPGSTSRNVAGPHSSGQLFATGIGPRGILIPKALAKKTSSSRERRHDVAPAAITKRALPADAPAPPGDVAVVFGKDEHGTHILRRRSQNAPVEAGVLRPLLCGFPFVGVVVSLSPRCDAPLLFDV